MKNLLITGYSGFIGKHLLNALDSYVSINLLGRSEVPSQHTFFKGSLDQDSDYSHALENVEVVIHLSARVHNFNDISLSSLSNYITPNVHGTLNLALQAAEAGVKRFIFMSTIKVNGENTNYRLPFKNDDLLVPPKDPYAISKYQAEIGLKEICKETGMEFVIIRPPLVYGPMVGANFSSLMSLTKRNLPLPFGNINNKRSFLGIDNLTQLIEICIRHEDAKNQIFLASDGNDISTTELIQLMKKAQRKKFLLFSLPSNFLKYAAKLIGKKYIFERLFGNLQINIEHTKSTLQWEPKSSLEETLNKMV